MSLHRLSQVISCNNRVNYYVSKLAFSNLVNLPASAVEFELDAERFTFDPSYDIMKYFKYECIKYIVTLWDIAYKVRLYS